MDTRDPQLVAAQRNTFQKAIPGQALEERLASIQQLYVEEEIAKKAKTLGVGYIDLRKVPVNPDYLAIISYRDAKNLQVIPFFLVGKKLRLAVLDIQKEGLHDLLESLKVQGYLVNINLVSEESFAYGLQMYEKYHLHEEEEAEVSPIEKAKAYEKEISNLQDLQAEIEHMAPEEALGHLEQGAMKTNASDIHLQPEKESVRVRFRIDGVLHDIFTLSHESYKDLVRQIKYSSHMKVNIVNVPQDGRFYFQHGEVAIQVRVSSLPTDYGETFVLRILDSSKGIMDFQTLGFEGYNLHTLYRALSKAAGVILLTGPTGSGKTTTLYSILNVMNAPEKKICTLEDPVEYRLPYLSQSQINEHEGYTFAKGLRAILRQDPDVIMLGEVRDLETGEIALQASLTGHVVLSTLHTNTAVESIPRLINMGLPSYLVAPGLNAVIAQRLVRKICAHCAYEVEILEKEREGIEEIVAEMKQFHPQSTISIPTTMKKGKGCEKCSHTGYLGQISLIEVLYVDQDIKDLILAGATTSDILDAARKKGMFTMLEVGLVRVFQGVTTLSEIYRVAKI